MRFEVFSSFSRERALQCYDEAVSKWPMQHTTLCEMRRARTGRLIGYRLQTAIYLVPLPQVRGAYFTPIRHH
jgi:hypothetical protein